MNLFVVQFVCKFPLIKDYKNISSIERNDLIKKSIEVARNKNGFIYKSTVKNDLFSEIKSEYDGESGILEVHTNKIVFRKNIVSDLAQKYYFEHYIKNIALVCQSYPDPLYFGYISRDLASKPDTSLYLFFSNKQAESVYKCISKGFKKSFSTENTVDDQINYVSMSAKVPNAYRIDSQPELNRQKEERRSCGGSTSPRSVTVNRNYQCLNHTETYRRESMSSNISDLNMYADSKRRETQSCLTNEESEMEFSLINPPTDDSVADDPIMRNTYVIEIIDTIPKSEIINFLKIKYDVNILCNSIFVERKRSCGPYEDIP